MNDWHRKRILPELLAGLCLVLGLPAVLMAAEPVEHKIELAGGKIVLQAPANWVPVQPKFKGIVQYEFSIPRHEDDSEDARVTIGPTSGDPKSNLNRWIAQYVQPDGSQSDDRAKINRKDVAGLTVHLLDVSGTYIRPPFSGGGRFKDYRLLATVIESKKLGLYYVKANGPQNTIASVERAFVKMIDGIQKK